MEVSGINNYAAKVIVEHIDRVIDMVGEEHADGIQEAVSDLFKRLDSLTVDHEKLKLKDSHTWFCGVEHSD